MKSVFIAYRADNWHTNISQRLIGASESLLGVIEIIREQVEKDGEKLSEDDLYLLEEIKQTQGYEGDGEFLIEEIELNKLL